MARPKGASKARTKKKILAAAQAHLEDVGPIAFSTRAVAREAGVSVAIVHHYYANRAGLLAAAIDETYARITALADRFRGTIRGGALDSPFWRTAAQIGFDFACANRAIIRALVTQAVNEGSLDAARQRSHEVPFMRSAGDALAAANGITPLQARLRLRSLVFLTARFAVASAKDLELHTGAADPAEQRALIIDHLHQTAVGYFPAGGSRKRVTQTGRFRAAS